MAHPARITITTGGRVIERGGGQEASVSVTYLLGPEDTDVLALVAEKATEVNRAQSLVWRRITAEPERPAAPPDRRADASGSTLSTAEQKASIRRAARHLGRSETDINRLVRARFGKSSVNTLAKSEAVALLVSFGDGHWPDPGDIA